MPEQMTILEAAARITAADVPVLLVDTCAAVDVIRAPLRDKLVCIPAAIEIAANARSTPIGLIPVSTELVWSEWNEHAPREQQNLADSVRKLDAQIDLLRNACERTGAVAGPRHTCADLDLPNRLSRIAHDLMNATIILTAEREYEHRGYRRSLENRPPARRGAQAKDCDIIEHYLALGRNLRNGGFDGRVVFASSNTKDYCRDGVVLHDNLTAEFGALNIAFVTDFAWALRELRA